MLKSSRFRQAHLLEKLFVSVVMFVAWFATERAASADERLKGIACRSVHLAFEAPKGRAFVNEVRVEKSAVGTYFCVCGFNHGYFGLQELGDGKKLLIFSVWDPGEQNDPNGVKEEQRVKLIHQGEGVRIGRFGGEGTGGQSFFNYDWKNGETYRFAVTAELHDKRTHYSGYFFHPEAKAWKRLVTFSTLAKGDLLGGYYSFVEDFRRNRISATQTRTAQYGQTWVLTAENKWQPVVKARFTADANPVVNIDAGSKDHWFFLSTGGDIKNEHVPLRQMIALPDRQKDAPVAPADTTLESLGLGQSQ